MKNEVITKAGIKYIKPKVSIIATTPLTSSEIGARVCYDSFSKADHMLVSNYQFGDPIPSDIGNSELVESLSHVYHHESIAEHTVVTYHIKDISRGVLQELVRHRIASYSVRSTRYTMSDLLIRAIIALSFDMYDDFKEYLLNNNLLIITGEMAILEIEVILAKLNLHIEMLSIDEIKRLIFSKAQLEIFDTLEPGKYNFEELSDRLLSVKNKRNVGDVFKYLVTDNWSTELIMTINLRNLKKFIELRMSGAAYFQINSLAHSMYEQLPVPYQRVVKKH